MAPLPKDRLLLRSKIEQQKTTIAALKQDGHETSDAERYLRELERELALAKVPKKAAPDGPSGSKRRSPASEA
jgi:hypothetical protein